VYNGCDIHMGGFRMSFKKDHKNRWTDTREERRARWARLLEEQALSGLSVAEWCRRSGAHTTTFFEWRRKLGGERLSTAGPQWLAVSPAEPHDATQAVPVGVASDAGLLTLRVGRVAIDICSGFDRELLRDALDVLESRAC
jgi:hypothetical protein